MVIKIGILKIGNIGTSPVVDLILDERADREDIDVKTFSSGAKMGKNEVHNIMPYIIENEFDLIIFISPNPSVGGPKLAREVLSEIKTPSIIIGDSPGIRCIDKMKQQNLGYILIKGDPMIGARREFLDPTEMAIFNADIIQVLAITGVFRLIHTKIDEIIEQIKNEKTITLPEIIIEAEDAVDMAGFNNPYAKSKAIAAYKIACDVSEIDATACFKIKDPNRYVPLVSSAHEMITTAAKLAREARELEKSYNSVLRTPHKRNGSYEIRNKLMD